MSAQNRSAGLKGSASYSCSGTSQKPELLIFGPASLGGLALISEEAIAWLSEWQKDKTACIMCMEADPDRCHRKQEIARLLENYGATVDHIR